MKKVICVPTSRKIVFKPESELTKWNEENPNEKAYVIGDKKLLEIFEGAKFYNNDEYGNPYAETLIDGQIYKITDYVISYYEKLLMSKAIKNEHESVLNSLFKHTVYSFNHTYKYNGKAYSIIIDADIIPASNGSYIEYWFSTEGYHTKIYIDTDMYNKDTEKPKDVIAYRIAIIIEQIDKFLKDYLEEMEKLKGA